MKTMRNYLIAASLAALISLTGTATAADETGTANAPKKEPLAPKHVILVDGRIDEFIGTDRVAGYGIGDPMKVTLIFDITSSSMFLAQHPDAPPPAVLPPLPVSTTASQSNEPQPANTAVIQLPTMLEWPLIEVEGLKMAAQTGKTTSDPSDVEVYKGATVETYPLADGRRRVVVTLVVTQYITTQKEADGKTVKTQADVSMDFAWAISRQPDGQPDWHASTTPALTFGIHQTADPKQTRLIEGDLADKVSPHAIAAWWFTFGGLPFVIPAIIALLLAAVRRVSRKRELTRNEKTWTALGKVLEQAHSGGDFSVGHYQRIFAILREHLRYNSITTTQAIEYVKTGVDGIGKPIDIAAGSYVFHQETVLFDPDKKIIAADRGELFRNIALLVPVETAELKQFLSLAGNLIPRP
jgi:hypothetical protein